MKSLARLTIAFGCLAAMLLVVPGVLLYGAYRLRLAGHLPAAERSAELKDVGVVTALAFPAFILLMNCLMAFARGAWPNQGYPSPIPGFLSAFGGLGICAGCGGAFVSGAPGLALLCFFVFVLLLVVDFGSVNLAYELGGLLADPDGSGDQPSAVGGPAIPVAVVEVGWRKPEEEGVARGA